MSAIAKAIPGRMTKFKISELSGVNKPAQVGARACFMKRDDGVDDDTPVLCEIMKRDFTGKERKQLADEGKALPDGSFPIVNEADLHNAVRAHGRASDKAKAKSHIIARASAMGMSSALPDGWVSKADPGQMEVQMDKELLKSLGLPETATMEQVVKALAEQNAKLTKAAADEKAKAEKSARRAAMTDDERDYTKAMSDDDADDFLAKPKADKEKKMADAKKADEILVVKGATIRKSEVGEGAFAFMKAQAEELSKTQEAFAKAEERAANATFEKRAAEEMPNTAGTVAERAAILKGIDAIADENLRKATLESVQAADKIMSKAFVRLGASGGIEKATVGAEAELNKKAEELRKADSKMTFAKSVEMAAEQNPDLYAKAREEQRQAAKAN